MAAETAIRIYVGGVGETVTAEDLRSTFSKMGAVEAVEFVRTKERSFAYIDFLPSSDKSLAKLFSAYNGCSWKGGKLRLERAKQHYLDRLSAEWAEEVEEAELSKIKQNDVDEMKEEDKNNKVVPQVGHKRGLDDKDKDKQIRMFFPNLRKFKSLPYSGTGKHKYSFQRVEALSLPRHFCDCVEHCAHPQATPFHCDTVENDGINEDEINMMNSVMNKLFERENSLASSTGPPASSQVDVEASKHYPLDQDHRDDDNIIINTGVISHGDESLLLERLKQQQTGLNEKVQQHEDVEASKHLSLDQDYEDDATDDDNIVINTGVCRGDETFLLESLKQQQQKLTKKATISVELEYSNDNLKQNKSKSSKKKTALARLGESGKELMSSVPNGENQLHKADEMPESSVPRVVSFVNRSSIRKRSEWNALGEHKDSISFTLSSLISEGESSKHLEHSEAHDPPVPSDDNHDLESVVHVVDQGSSDPIPPSQSKQDGSVGSSDKPARGASWTQKSSWTKLVGGTNSGAFSISQLITGKIAQKKNSQTPHSHQDSIPVEQSHQSDPIKRKRKGNDDLDSGKEGKRCAPSRDLNIGFMIKEKDQNVGLQVNAHEFNNEAAVPAKIDRVDTNLPGERGNSVEKRNDRPTLLVSDTCPFMRNASSLQEWKTTKEALNRSLKKKKDQSIL